MYSTEFSGKIAVVTGAAQGIGKATAQLLAACGARLALIDRQSEKLRQLCRELIHTGGEASAYPLDISDSVAVNRTIEQIERNQGPIAYLAQVAGILHLAPVIDTSDRQWQQTFAVNTTGAFNLCRAVAAGMVKRKAGAIVAVGSNAARTPRIGMAAYAASKAALGQLIKCLGLELAEHGIRCNLVSPGSTDTDMQRQLWRDGAGEQQVIEGSLASYRTGIPLRKIATPEAVAEAVLFLLSTRAGHITLQDLCVDGGATLGG